MNHRNTGRRLNRTSAHKKALLCNMAASLFLHERIKTTTPKAKELRSFAEKLITLGKRGDLHARRQVAALLKDSTAISKLFAEIGPRFAERNGGYLRIVHIGKRAGDNAPLSYIELVDAAEATVDSRLLDVPETAVEAETVEG